MPAAAGDVGVYACPVGTGTNTATTKSSIAECDHLYDGYYYKGPGPISSSTIDACDAGYYCATNGVAIVVNTTTPNSVTTGRITCPVGTRSTAGVYSSGNPGPSVAEHCTQLLPGYSYNVTGGVIDLTTILKCPDDKYCEGVATLDLAVSYDGVFCPAGSGVANPAYPAAGASTVNECTKLYAGYYYTGIGALISTTNVQACLADSYCPGYNPQTSGTPTTITIGTPIMPHACPAGTTVAAGTTKADSATRVSAYDGGMTIADCDTLVAGWYYDGTGAISNTTVKKCGVTKYCNTDGVAIVASTITSSANYTDCPTGVQVPADKIGGKVADDCTELQPTYYYDGTGAISSSSIKSCTTGYWCGGYGIISLASSTPQGRVQCTSGTSSSAGSMSMNNCTDLSPSWYYTGSGDITSSTVLPCPVDNYCTGAATIAVSTDGIDQGIQTCPTGSGSALSSSSLQDCTTIYPGYYFLGDAAFVTATVFDATAFKVCDDPLTTAYCPGGTVGSDLSLAYGRTLCSSVDVLRPKCDVLTPGTDCVKPQDCVSL